MKNVLILGATGRIGSLLTNILQNENSIKQTLYVRNADKLPAAVAKDTNIIVGDVLDTEALSSAMEGQDEVVAVLSGDVLAFAQSIASAMKSHNLSQVIWVTGMGIHHEVPGEVGKMLDKLVEQMQSYVVAADTIAESGVPYTLVRAAHLTDGDNDKYYLQNEGEELHSNAVDRIAVAKFIASIILGKTAMKNTSVGITN
jgi:uncharacterized protein YbjT (DUF2867 family)